MTGNNDEFLTRVQASEVFEVEQAKNLARIYAKKSCKSCYGRGYNLYDMIDKSNPQQKFLIYCECAKKRMKKNNG